MTVTGRAITETAAVSTEKLLEIHASMARIRTFEERMRELFLADRLPGFVHLYVGEEAIAAGICAALRRDDYIASTHRGHGHALAKGARMDQMAAEIMGKATGMCGGKGGSMHVADFSVGMLGCNGIVGGGIGIATGAAFSAKYRGTDQVAVAFFGDGASSKGQFHEALNWAAAKKLPAIFVCENNHYAQFTDPAFTVSVENIADRATGYGIPGEVVDGQDAQAVFEAASRAVARARRGEGPTLLEMKTYRYYGHYVGDPERYRSREEVAEWRARDPLSLLEGRLLEERHCDRAAIDASLEAARHEMEEAERFAFESPLPDVAQALADVYAPSLATTEQPGGGLRDLTFGEATREAMRQAMTAAPNVVVMGEDIHWGGNFGQFNGLYDEFGPDRVVDMPISEPIIVSTALGAAITGLRPIISMSFVDFTLSAADELFNQVSKIRYMFGGQVRVPLVFRASDGAVRQAAAQHSQCLEAIFAHLPGLKVVAPSTVADAKGLLAAAIADGNPVMYLEHKVLGKAKGPAPAGEYLIPIGKAAVAREGADVTVVTYSLMTRLCLEVAEQLAGEGIDVEVIDLRSVAPIDWDTIADSVRKTHRAVVVHEAYMHGGLGAEIAARIGRDLFDELDGPVERVGARHAPMPFSPPLENAVLPSTEDIRAAIRTALG
ncbi:MAG: dehydrogenase E1 component subunit alpha/beta [Chloroflexi bacterium]|nr:dehydrogenase E1 component subunit alpha/beta [Chloroflexota bacterium]